VIPIYTDDGGTTKPLVALTIFLLPSLPVGAIISPAIKRFCVWASEYVVPIDVAYYFNTDLAEWLANWLYLTSKVVLLRAPMV